MFRLYPAAPPGVGLFPAAPASLGGASQRFPSRAAAGAAGGTAERSWRVSSGRGVLGGRFSMEFGHGVVHSHWAFFCWMVFFLNPFFKWVRSGGTPILGKHHIRENVRFL